MGLLTFSSGMWPVRNKCLEKAYGMRPCKYLNHLSKAICRELELVDVDPEKKIINLISSVLTFEATRFSSLKLAV